MVFIVAHETLQSIICSIVNNELDKLVSAVTNIKENLGKTQTGLVQRMKLHRYLEIQQSSLMSDSASSVCLDIITSSTLIMHPLEDVPMHVCMPDVQSRESFAAPPPTHPVMMQLPPCYDAAPTLL